MNRRVCKPVSNVKSAPFVLLFLLFSINSMAQLPKVDGWTQFVPGSDTRIIYVSDSEGNDATAQYYSPGASEIGADPFKPTIQIKAYKTLEAAATQLRNGFPDWILFRKGDVFENQSFGVTTRFGKSRSEPMLFGTYGKLPERAVFYTGDKGFIDLAGSSASYLAFFGLEMEPHTRTGADEPIGIRIINAPFSDILIEDCYIGNYFNNLVVHDPTSPPAATRKKLTVRRSVLADAYVTTAAHANAMFIENVDSILFEENLLDHNGWKTDVPGADPTGFRHNSYFQVNCSNLVFRENIVARAAATGGGFRCGGTIYNNTFLDNPKNIQFGTHESTIDWPTVSVHGEVAYNVILGSRVTDFDRGKGITVQRASNTKLHHNIVAHFKELSDYNLGIFFTESENIDFQRNIVYNWGNNTVSGPAYAGAIVIGNMISGTNTLDSNEVQIHNLKARCIINNGTYNNLVFTNNRYFNAASPDAWFEPGGSYENWQLLSGENGGAKQTLNYPDPERDPQTYLTDVGLSGGLHEFLNYRRSMSKNYWLKFISAADFNNYVRTGFNMGTITATEAPGNVDDKNVQFHCHPNPFNAMIHISWGPVKDGEMSLEIFDISGRKLRSLSAEAKNSIDGNISFDGSELNPGIYLCVLKSGQSLLVRKIVKL